MAYDPWGSINFSTNNGPNEVNYNRMMASTQRALYAKPLYSDAAIDSTLKSTIYNPMAARWAGQKEQLGTAAALGGGIDSGGYGRYVAEQGAANDAATAGAMLQKAQGMYGENATFADEQKQNAVNNLMQWIANNRSRRMGRRDIEAALAGMQSGGGGGIWDMLGAGAGIAGAFMGGK